MAEALAVVAGAGCAATWRAAAGIGAVAFWPVPGAVSAPRGAAWSSRGGRDAAAPDVVCGAGAADRAASTGSGQSGPLGLPLRS